MIITQSQKSGKFSISNVTETELINLYHSTKESNINFARVVYQALVDYQDDEAIQNEYGYSVEEFLANLNVVSI